MAFWPTFTSVASTWGTFTNTRSVVDAGELCRGLIAEQICLGEEQGRACLLELGVDLRRGNFSQ
jgi:hypothetical protein